MMTLTKNDWICGSRYDDANLKKKRLKAVELLLKKNCF